MRPFWLLEADAWGPSSESLKREIRRQGMEHSVILHETFASGYQNRVGNHVLQDQDCVIFLGTWPLWRHIQLRWPSWIPGGWCATENLDCSVYYSQFYPYLLNRDCSILSGESARSQQRDLFARYERDGRVFIRPSGCIKIFNGRCVDEPTFASATAPARYDAETRIVVASPQTIEREWRFVIAEHQPLVACQYLHSGNKRISRGCPTEVWQFTATAMQRIAWEPDDVFVMDVCESDGHLHIVELNGFSCAGLYDCDLSIVVARVGDLAERAWKERSSREDAHVEVH